MYCRKQYWSSYRNMWTADFYIYPAKAAIRKLGEKTAGQEKA